MIEDSKAGKYGGVCRRGSLRSRTAICISDTPKRSVWISDSPAEFGGKCNLRMDDTNPSKEETEYVDSIQEDVRWLGFDWDDRLFYASDYFDQLYALGRSTRQGGKSLRLRSDRRADP